jgi:ribosomal protein S6--L-glutamate ligase
MIASLHPCIEKDLNILCAGRSLTVREKKRLARAGAVILPQGVTAGVYRECRRLVPRVFPNYDLRFGWEGKVGDALLFDFFQVPHPRTLAFRDGETFFRTYRDLDLVPPLLSGYPLVFKGNSGGEGSMVFLVRSHRELLDKMILLKSPVPEQRGFILQEFIDHGGRDLRVVVLYDRLLAYWRVQPDPRKIHTNLAEGGKIDFQSDPRLRRRGIEAVRRFCRRSGINLAGFDLVFNRNQDPDRPQFLEINYYFGRKGLGGSLRFYELFQEAADRWLAAGEAPVPESIDGLGCFSEAVGLK